MGSKNSEYGSILIVVVWVLFFLSALVLAINAYIRPRIGLGGKLLNRAKAHYYAEAGVKQAMLELEKDDTDLYDCLSDGWSVNTNAFGEKKITGGIFRFKLVDEERKININKAPRDVLKNLFEIVGGEDSQAAEALADSIIDWRDEDDDASPSGAENGYYSMLRPGYNCKNADFDIAEELLVVKGMTRKIFDKVKERITVYSEGPVNINTADKLVLMSLGMGDELAEKVLNFRDVDGNIFDDDGGVADSLNQSENLSAEDVVAIDTILSKNLFSVFSYNFSGHASGKAEGRPDLLEITFVYNRDEKSIKYWREN